MSGEVGCESTLGSRLQSGRHAGFALAAALFTLLLISALVTGVFFAITEETRASSAVAEREHARVAAETVIEMTIADWNTDWSGSIGATVTRSVVIAGTVTPVLVHITRLDSTLYWIVADAASLSRGRGVSCRIGVAVSAVASVEHSITIDRISERSWSELY